MKCQWKGQRKRCWPKYLLKCIEFVGIRQNKSHLGTIFLADKVVSHQGYGLTILKPLYMLTGIEQPSKWMLENWGHSSYCYVEV